MQLILDETRAAVSSNLGMVIGFQGRHARFSHHKRAVNAAVSVNESYVMYTVHSHPDRRLKSDAILRSAPCQILRVCGTSGF